MAVTTTAVRRTGDSAYFTVVSDGAGDTTTALVPHGLGAAVQITLIPLIAKWWLSLWRVTLLDATGFTVVKTAGAGSADAAAQMGVLVQRRR